MITSRSVLDKGEVALLGYFGDDEMIANTARVSYRKGTKQRSTEKQLIRYLMRNRHTSPFEHVSLRWYIKAPLFVIQQLLRHRTFKFNQSSARYSEMLDEAYLPMAEHITKQDYKNKQTRTDEKVDDAYSVKDDIYAHNLKCFEFYNNMLEGEVAREVARTVLPHGTYSELIVTCDLHNFMHFLSLRMHPHAQYEMRVYAEAMYDMAKGIFPLSMEAWDDCILYNFTLTGQMQEVLSTAIELVQVLNNWPQSVVTAANDYEWVSISERDEFVSWCIKRLNIQSP